MNISPISNIVSRTAGPSQGLGGAPDAGEGFGAMLAQVGASTMSALQKAESVSTAALQGKGDTRAVVEAVMQAEQSLQTALAVRDKMVAAFQEITRMAI